MKTGLPKFEDVNQAPEFTGKIEMSKIPIGEYKLVGKELDVITSNIKGSTLKEFNLNKEELQEVSLTSSNDGNNIIMTLVVKMDGKITNLIQERVWGNARESTELGNKAYNAVSVKFEPPITIGENTIGKYPDEFIKKMPDFLTFTISDSQFLLAMPFSNGKEPEDYMIMEKQENSSDNNNTTLYIIIASLVVIILIILFMTR